MTVDLVDSNINLKSKVARVEASLLEPLPAPPRRADFDQEMDSDQEIASLSTVVCFEAGGACSKKEAPPVRQFVCGWQARANA